MLILFDHGTPAPLRSFLKDHIVKKTKDLGWDTLSNGELLRAAEEAAFEIFLTTDKNIRYQQNLADRAICDRGSRQFTMAGRTAVYRSGRGRDRCLRAGYLYGGRNP
jgi:hypothetical protein